MLGPAVLGIALLLAVRSGTYMRWPSRALLAMLAVGLVGYTALMGAFYLTFGHRGGGGATFEPVAVPVSSGHSVNVVVADSTGLVVHVDNGSGPPGLTGPQTAELDAGRAVALPVAGSNDLYLRWLTGGCWFTQSLDITGTQDRVAVVIDQGPLAWITIRLRMAYNVTDTTVDISRADE